MRKIDVKRYLIVWRNIILISLWITPSGIRGNPVIFSVEPSLLDSDLRLAGMGDIGIVIEGINNQINLYDFGALGAGFIDDDTLNTYLFIPGFLCFDMTREEYEQTAYFLYKLFGKGFAKFNNNALGGSAGILRKKLRFYSPQEMFYVEENHTYINDTLIFCYRFKNFATAIRGGYEIERIISRRLYGPYHTDIDVIDCEPSFLLKTKGNPWAVGLGYDYRKVKHHFEVYGSVQRYNFHTIKLPVVFSDSNLNLGLKFDYSIIQNGGDTIIHKGWIFKIKKMRKIRFDDKYFSLGFESSYENVYQLFEYRDLSGDKKFEVGFGFSYLNRLGIQYEHEVHYYSESFAGHFNRLSQGYEFPTGNQLMLRFGYSLGFPSKGSRYYFNDLESIISAGMGFYPFDSKSKVDLALRLKFYRYSDWWCTEPNFGLSFRIF